MEFPYTGGTITCIGDRERFGPKGIFGGDEGGKAGLVVNLGTENERNIGIFALNAEAVTGEVMTFWSAGGGGYGDPLEREPELIIEDMMDDYVTVQEARDLYGVVVEAKDRRRLLFEVDAAATATLRQEMAKAR